MMKILMAISFATSCKAFWDTKEVCYGDLGCFRNDGPFFHFLLRPYSLLPSDPEKINTTFLLFTKQNVNNAQKLDRKDAESLRHSHYRSHRKKTYFVVHGYTHNSKWTRQIKDSLLKVGDVNVFLVDWSGDSESSYPQAAADTRVVGREIGNFLKALKDVLSLNLSRAHIIGHSLGAHIAGYAGEWLNSTKLGRITGLDPAGPFFQYMPNAVRLDPSDATFVDAIHTAGDVYPYTSFGSWQPNGHADFYPDSGFSIRGCESGKKYSYDEFFEELRDYVMCGHQKAIDIYLQSIEGKCRFTAFSCYNFQPYAVSNCDFCQRPGYDCTEAGYGIDKYSHTELTETIFYFTTTEVRTSLCLYHWTVDIRVIATENINGPVQFQLFVKGKSGSMLITELQSSSKQIVGNLRYLLEFTEDPITIEKVEFSWNRHKFDLIRKKRSIKPLIFIGYLTFDHIDQIDQRLRENELKTFCHPNMTKGVSEGINIILKAENECRMQVSTP